jgi:hypothetical protein
LKTKFLSTVKLTVNRMAFEEIIKDWNNVLLIDFLIFGV